MMNYQYPQTYIMDNPEQLINKIAPTPPPILPSLDPTEVEQTLYQRRVPDANETESIQPLDVYPAKYYQTVSTVPHSYSPPAQQRSAPVQPKNALTANSSLLFSKTPRSIVNAVTPIKKVEKVNVPSTPPPPPMAHKVSNKAINIKSNDIVAITPQSHTNLNSNSASNHSTASGHTQSTTIIESASNHSSVIKIPAPPTLSNPLPPKLSQDIIVPMDHTNYNALLQQMYPQQIQHPASFNPASSDFHQNRNYQHTLPDLYPTYDAVATQNYPLYNTPPLPHHTANNGYYNNSNYYAAQNNYGALPKSAEIYNAHTMHSNYYERYSPYDSFARRERDSVEVTPSRTSPGSASKTNSVSPENMKVDYLQRCDGTIISPMADPLTVAAIKSKLNNDDNLDAFTAGDDALFGNNMVTLISVNWTTNIPFATIRMHASNRIHHVPLMDLNHINHKREPQQVIKQHSNRYRINNINTVTAVPTIAETTIIRRNPKLSDETLMKLPHLRKHREYIRTIDVNMGPKDYNSFRVSVNSKNANSEDIEIGSGPQQNINNGRTANIQNLNAKNVGNLNASNNLNANLNRKKNKRMSVCEKGDLFKTELCENWVKKGHCTYGKKCHFAHGRDDIRTRWRIENYKTQPCCDPARADSRLCLFGKRCNYAHPGEPLRRSHHCLYLDEEYQAEILKDYGSTTPYPFGIYI